MDYKKGIMDLKDNTFYLLDWSYKDRKLDVKDFLDNMQSYLDFFYINHMLDDFY